MNRSASDKALRLSGILFALFLVMWCFSCDTSTHKTHSAEFFAMDTFIEIKVYGKNADSALDKAKTEVERLEALFSVSDENSEIFKLNRDKLITPSWETLDLISKSFEISQKTNGAFDITVYPLVSLYGFTTKEYNVPSQNQINSALAAVGYENIETDGNRILLKNSACVDLGAIAKGYCGDRIAQILQQNDVSGGVISLGGNVTVFGEKPDGSGFLVAIRDPENQQDIIGHVAVSDCSIVTSGAYQRYFEENGVIYHHIIDPKTGKCAESGLLSVTVICKSGYVADALSTAFFVQGKDAICSFVSQNPDISVIFVDDEKNVCVVGNTDFTPNADSDYEYLTLE